MSRFYGMLKGNRGEATRCGTPDSGMVTHCASWSGAVRCQSYIKDGKDYVDVRLTPWHGKGGLVLLYDGPMDAAEAPQSDIAAALIASLKLSEATQKKIIALVEAELMLRGV